MSLELVLFNHSRTIEGIELNGNARKSAAKDMLLTTGYALLSNPVTLL
jgi:hypothetical protein